MNLPSPEVCQQLLAFHVLLGYSQPTDEARDGHRKELLDLMAAHGLKWSDWPAFFEAQNIVPSQPLPPVDSPKWQKHCEKARQLHSAMGSADKDAAVAHKKLIAEVAKQKFIWSSDLPAILAAHWIHHNPTVVGTASAAPSAPNIDVFVLTKAVIEDRVVLSPAALVVATLIALCSHVCEQFAKVPQLGIVAPTPGFGKSTLLKVLQCLVARPWATKHATAPAIYRYLRRHPRITLLLDALENQNLIADSVLCTILDACHEGGNKALVEDKESITIEIHVLVIWAIRGAIRDVPSNILSRGVQIEMQQGMPRVQEIRRNDPEFYGDLDIASEEIKKWAATCTLDFSPEIPVELNRDSRLKDVCLALLSVADSLGHGAEARQALIELSAARPPRDDGEQALKDAKLVFEALGIDRISKKDLTKEIMQRGDPMWGYYRGLDGRQTPHELRPTEMANIFARFHLYAKTVWPKGPRKPGGSAAGYYKTQFEKPWAKHCPDSSTSSQARKIIPLPRL
jgi:hypothetical protein